MSDAAFDALKKACRDQIEWLQLHASNYEQGHCKHIEICDGSPTDKSAELAEQYRHQANNLQAIINACERLHDRLIDH